MKKTIWEKIQENSIIKALIEYKWWAIGGFVFFLLLLNVILARFFIPNEFTLATGNAGGNYSNLGNFLKDELKEKGINIEIINTEGSVENLDLLKEKKVDMAFLQNGLVNNSDKYPNLKGVASLYYEPIFLFYRKEINLTYLNNLRGKYVSIGQKGSGTYSVVKDLFEKSGLKENDFFPSYLTYNDAKNRLIKGDLDAAFFITSVDNNIVKELVDNKDIELYSFNSYKAYKHYFKNLGIVKIPVGFYDLGRGIPQSEITLLTTLATIVAQKEVHPTLVEALLNTINNNKKIINTATEFGDEIDSFPSEKLMDFSQHNASEVFFREGPSFLSQYVSYYFIFFVSRLKFLLIPLIPFLLIFIKVAPGAYKLKLMFLLKKKYKELNDLEQVINHNDTLEILSDAKIKLDEIKKDMDEDSQKIPSQYQKEIYDWKLHCSLLENSLEEKLEKVKFEKEFESNQK